MAIGFIGLGNIGKPMARHLLALNEELWVYDVAQAPVAELVAAGAKAAASPAELAARCRYIGLCVRDEHDVESLLQGTDGLLARAQPDTLIAVHSTVSHTAILRWHTQAAAAGKQLIDAPMTGGAGGAEAGTLCYMVGGDDAMIERGRPLWDTSAARIVHAGGVGAGIMAKLCNNLMTYAAFAAIHEAGKLADAAGLSMDVLNQVGEANGVITPQMRAFFNNRRLVEEKGGAAALDAAMAPHGRLGSKDLEAALQCAAALQVELPMTRLNRTLIEDVFLNKI